MYSCLYEKNEKGAWICEKPLLKVQSESGNKDDLNRRVSKTPQKHNWVIREWVDLGCYPCSAQPTLSGRTSTNRASISQSSGAKIHTHRLSKKIPNQFLIHPILQPISYIIPTLLHLSISKTRSNILIPSSSSLPRLSFKTKQDRKEYA